MSPVGFPAEMTQSIQAAIEEIDQLEAVEQQLATKHSKIQLHPRKILIDIRFAKLWKKITLFWSKVNKKKFWNLFDLKTQIFVFLWVIINKQWPFKNYLLSRTIILLISSWLYVVQFANEGPCFFFVLVLFVCSFWIFQNIYNIQTVT